MSYQQLTEGQRYQLSVLRAQGMSILATARAIGVHRSTLYRELRRNAGPQGYQPDNAHQHATHRRASAAKSRLSADVIQFVELTLAWWWSPEQISAVGKQIGLMVSHEWIYRHVAADKARGGQLYRHLRQGHKRYRKGASSLRSPIKEARSIDERPAIVDSRERLGDWEADTVLGKQGTGALVTLVIASLAGYGFEIYQSKLRDKVYNLLLLTMMIPFAALMIPLFSMMAKANLLDTHWAVVLPSVASVYIIFYFRQCTKAFPKELLDAARVDGVKEWQIFVYVFFPVMRSTYAAAFIITFMANWNNFLWPLIVLQTPDMKTINLVLSSLSSAYVPDFGVVMIGTVAATLPTIAVFFAMQKQFVQGMVGSVK